MLQIHVCFEYPKGDLIEVLKRRFEILTTVPRESYSLCLVDSISIDRIEQPIKDLKALKPEIFMPVLLVTDKTGFQKLEGRINGLIDDVVLEPIDNAELQLRINAFLQAHLCSLKSKQSNDREKILSIEADRLATMSAKVPAMIYQFGVLYDGTMRFDFISDGCRQLFEIEPQEALKNSLLIISAVHPDERVQFEKTLTEAIKNRGEFSWIGRYVIKDKIKWIKVGSIPSLAPNGLIWNGVMVDVTRLKEAEESVRSDALLKEQIIENVKTGILVCDKEMRIIKWNRAMEEISGMSQNQVLGHDPQELFPFLSTKGVYSQLQQALVGVRGITKEYTYDFSASNKTGLAKNEIIPLLDVKGEIAGVCCLFEVSLS